MKIINVAFLIFTSFQLLACSKNNDFDHPENQIIMHNSKLKITIATTVFTATLYNNETANAFKAMLPLSINMSDLNKNEKFYNFAAKLPTNASIGGNIQAGDLMLYGNNCLVLFYENFSTSYSYTKIGKIENVSALAAALGTGNVEIKYELYEDKL